jgi:tetratricopeptide (TPR) repeat protein
LDGDPKGALSIKEDLVRREPKNCGYWYELGIVLHLLGNDEEALKALRTAYSLCPNSEISGLIQSIQNTSPSNNARSAGGGTECPHRILGRGP